MPSYDSWPSAGRETTRLSSLVEPLVRFTVTTLLSALTWTAFGVGLRRLLHDPAHARIFNIAMGVLLVVSIVPMVM